MMNVTAAVIEPELAGGAIGYIAALGQCGSAVFPWITGALAGRYGVWALQREFSGLFAVAVRSSEGRLRRKKKRSVDEMFMGLIVALLVAMLALEGMLWAVVLFMSRHKWKRTHKF
jgi:MFS family permease